MRMRMTWLVLPQIRRHSTATSTSTSTSTRILGATFPTDAATNLSASVLERIPRRLHKVPNHPIAIIKERIEDYFVKTNQNYKIVDSLSPAVSTTQNFDQLLFDKDHSSRSPSDTYYVNKDTVLRTHTSAHQSEVLAGKQSNVGYLLTADVYRRDEIDLSHYPVFHQMEGIRIFDRKALLSESSADTFAPLPKGAKITDPTGLSNPETNPLQVAHAQKDSELVALHLKRALEGLVWHLFGSDKNLEIRWIEAYFPFTSPSWEMEVMYQGKWLELLGCGVIQQKILDDSGNPDKIGWAFGLGLERIAMVMFGIPDIRLFWSQDSRFLSQFENHTTKQITFQPYSKYPACYKDVSFWCPDGFHDNDMFEVVRDMAGDLAEDVALIDTFKNPKTGRTSKCFRINYRSMDRTLSNEDVDIIQDKVREEVARRCGVELRG
ncbi:phenylalanyl-tRNA synthetase [Rhizoclosmatium globosum]|uniref:Phenylalanine--tRNA ligase, mitochondrial n=1 Tax=Rhizoclosmatium globosum TaxID=329046 RepID=A0A1Y2BXC0_9FUNG|nr:phenylalanyl-tRNA synthetase [Rhizoclosmatium globosum]|eukprot:ORY39403.1 phenylalanyl-tRNA synthetase [Rhizoclosmatium globosum]